MESKELDELIRQERTNVTNAFLKAAKVARNEREFQTAATGIIQNFADCAQAQISLREEYTLFNGRADAVYNRFIIEYEAPGSLRDKNSFGHNQHAIGQVKQYLTDLVRRERHKAERLAGVVFNGDYFIWVRQREDSWYIDDPVPIRPETTERFLRTLCSLCTERALIPENLVEDFGENANVSRQAVSTLYGSLADSKARRVKVLFEQWSRQFSEVCDYDSASKLNVAEHARAYGIKESGVDPFKFFFCLHTYYAFLIKLLALQIVHFYLMPKLGTDLRAAGAKSSEDLRKYLMNVESGGIFHELGINNLMEGDFFGWYLDGWDERIEGACRQVIDTLGNYAADTLDIDPDTSRDLLKNLYQNLMPKKLRHNLGEYYTPDWLAERALGMLDGSPEETVRGGLDSGKVTRINVYRGDPEKRLLDPACGSGTFLVMAIKRIKQYAWRNTRNEREVLDLILKNVVGFDLNPLAVISARANYLLALGDLLKHRSGDINIPVYLCDSIMLPSEDIHIKGEAPTLGLKSGRYAFPTAVGTFVIPADMVNERAIDELAAVLEQSVQQRVPVKQFEAKIRERFRLNQKRLDEEVRQVTELYEHLLRLDEEGINGIWARIIKNAFAPIFVGRFDLIAGNPPWINWEHLPEQYRDETKPLWDKYGLFTLSGWDARMGGGKKDISILMMYVAADRFLKESGRLAFVITQSIFKTEGAGNGFRRFRIGRTGPKIGVTWLDDWSTLKPFEGAANKTVIVICQRDRETRYPVGCGFWRKRSPRTRLGEHLSINEVTQVVCKMSSWNAAPINSEDPCSPWITGRANAIKAVRRLVGQSDYAAHAGLYGGLNGVYLVQVVSRQTKDLTVIANANKNAKRPVDEISAAVEHALLFPVVRGEDVKRWMPSSSGAILVPHDVSTGQGIPENDLKDQYPRCYKYLANFKQDLLKRGASQYKTVLPEGRKPFYWICNVLVDGEPRALKPHKVAWTRVGNDISCAVLGSEDGKPRVPIETACFVDGHSNREVHFICALMNSSPFRYGVVSYSVHGTGGFASPHILTHLRVPKFSASISEHSQLVECSLHAHRASESDDTARIDEIEDEVDRLAGKIWGLSATELKAIQSSLNDLRGAGE